jgi:hypothetical protein
MRVQGIEATATARLVYVGCPDYHELIALDQTLGAICRAAAADADGERFGDIFGYRQQLWHGIEWLPPVILIEPGYDHTLSHVCQLVTDRDDLFVKKLRLVDSYHFGAIVNLVDDFSRCGNDCRSDFLLAVRNDMIGRIARINLGLENLYALASDLSAAQTADQLLAFAAEHAPADYLDPSGVASHLGFHGARSVVLMKDVV